MASSRKRARRLLVARAQACAQTAVLVVSLQSVLAQPGNRSASAHHEWRGGAVRERRRAPS